VSNEQRDGFMYLPSLVKFPSLAHAHLRIFRTFGPC